jgi:chromosome partitioning protein
VASASQRISINLSEALGKLGKKVLLLDMDPQSNSSTGVGINAEAMAMATMTEVLIDGFPIHEAIVDSKFGFGVVPATIALSEAEVELIMRMSRESVLFNSLLASQDHLAKYDYIFIDCPPSLGLLDDQRSGGGGFLPHPHRGQQVLPGRS